MAIGDFSGGGVVAGLIGSASASTESPKGSLPFRCNQQFVRYGNAPSDAEAGETVGANESKFHPAETGEELHHLQRQMRTMDPSGNVGGNAASGAQLHQFMNFQL